MSKLSKLFNVSLNEGWQILRNPEVIPMYLNGPSQKNPAEAMKFLFPSIGKNDIEDLRLEIQGNHEFFDELNRKMFSVRKRRVRWLPWNEFLYFVIRTLKPETVVETGVFDGQSSSVILEAMRKNEKGMLISVDLPATQSISGSTDRMSEGLLPPNLQPGWLIPDALRSRHRLLLGDAKEILPPLKQEFPSVDLFFHDSLHTFEHMMFEFNLAWPWLRPGGVLLSDDILWNPSFYKFCKEKNVDYAKVYSFGATIKR